MSYLYLLALGGVVLALVALVADAVWSVSRKPRWTARLPQPQLQLVVTEDRRKQSLPFVGVDRRRAAAAEPVKLDRAA